MNTITQKIETILSWLRPKSSNENAIDLQKTFSAAGIDIFPIVVKILELEAGFPSSQIQSKEGTKYHELEFFESNIDSGGKNTEKSLFQRLDKTHLALGSNLLKSMILQPCHTHQKIHDIVINRQHVIQKIINDRFILLEQDQQLNEQKQQRKITDLLDGLKNIEKELLAMCLDDTPEMIEVYKIIFFETGPLKYLNYNAVFLKLFYYFMIIFSPLYGLVSPFIFIFAPFIFMKYIMKIPIQFDAFWNLMKKMLFGGTGFFSMLDKFFNSTVGDNVQSTLNNGSVTIKGAVFWLAKNFVTLLNSSIGGYAYIGFIIASYLYGIYNSFQVSITFNKIINMFHSRLNIISSWLKECMVLFESGVCFNSIEVKPILTQIQQILQSSKLVQTLLSNPVFNREPGIISDKGIIIKCFRQFLDAKNSKQTLLEPFCKYIAYVDTFTAIGSWVIEKADRSFANFILEADRPQVQGTDIWNLCCNTPIYNDVLLGGYLAQDNNPIEEAPSAAPESSNVKTSDDVLDKSNEKNDDNVVVETDNKDDSGNSGDSGDKIKESLADVDVKEVKEELRDHKDNSDDHKDNSDDKVVKNKNPVNNIIITGPNGSGKSTYIKSVTECIILAQTIGVVPAREFSLTPFAHISTYLNIPDCQGKESLFQAEMNRCYQQLETLRAAEESGEFSFNIMDEIFVSTNYQEGMSGAYAVINQMCRFNKCLNIITTHFDKLANMEELPVGRKYFDIDILEDGQVAKDYKIREGVSRKHMALRLLRNRGFSDEIIKDAENFYEKINQ